MAMFNHELFCDNQCYKCSFQPKIQGLGKKNNSRTMKI